jgi:hypothetical protein
LKVYTCERLCMRTDPDKGCEGVEPKHGMPALVLKRGEKTMLQGLRLALRFGFACTARWLSVTDHS